MMEETLLKIFSEYGIPTAMLIFMAWLFLTFTRIHREERKEWREDAKAQMEKQTQAQEKTNEVLRSLTGVIQEVNRQSRN